MTSTAVIRDALTAECGEHSAVLVCGRCPTGAGRIVELGWTRWAVDEPPEDQVDTTPAGRAESGWAR